MMRRWYERLCKAVVSRKPRPSTTTVDGFMHIDRDILPTALESGTRSDLRRSLKEFNNYVELRRSVIFGIRTASAVKGERELKYQGRWTLPGVLLRELDKAGYQVHTTNLYEDVNEITIRW